MQHNSVNNVKQRIGLGLLSTYRLRLAGSAPLDPFMDT